MKKTILFLLLLLNFFFSNANTRISSYRWRNDDGSETTATWKAAINTPIQINNLDPIRIRIAVEEFNGSTGFIAAIDSNLLFSVDGGTNWTNVTDVNSPFSFVNTANVIHESFTTQQISTGSTASFVAGRFISAYSSLTTNMASAQNKFTEFEFSIKPNALISSSVTYLFKMSVNGTNLVTPALKYCPFAPAVVSTPQTFNGNAKVSNLVATGTDLKWFTSLTGGSELDATTDLIIGSYFLQTSSCESSRTEVQVNVDKNGATLNFAGGYVDLPFNMPATYTKEAWINVRDFSAVNNIISGGSSEGEHAIYIPNGVLSSGHNSYWKAVEDIEPIDAGTWYHVAVTYDLATTTMILYKNGVKIDENNSVFPFTGNLIRIGAFDQGGNLFNGAIDEARIWNKVLTQAEIQNNMNCEFSGSQTGLVGYYKFNQGLEGADNSAVSTLTDSSGNGNNGTLINFNLSASSSNWISSSIIQTGNTCTILGVGDHDSDFNSDLKVYPNPSSSAFFIDSNASGTIVIFDLLGKTVKTQKINSGTTSLDLGNVTNGTYLLKVTNEKNQSKTVKLIKN